MTTIQQKTQQYILNTYARAPFVLERGEGMEVIDSEGQRYLDFGSGISVNALGHADLELITVVADQIARLSHVSNLYYTIPQAELAESLCRFSFADKVYFANTGTEAIEAAIKFARKFARVTYGPGKTGVVAFTGSFHGRTAGALALTAREKYQAAFRPLMPDVTFAPFNDCEAAEKMIGPGTCAVFVEPVQGEGGIHAASAEFLACLRELCDRYGALLVFDEIQSGLGRTGKLWAYEYADVQPDMLAAAKALGGGLPIGVTLLTDRVASVMEPGDHGSTFAGGPVVCRAAQVVFERVNEPAMLAHVAAMGTYLVGRLHALRSSHIKDIRGLGLMVGVEFDMDVAPIIQSAFAHNVLLLNAGPRVLRLLPPLIVEEEHIDRLVDVLDTILAEQFPG